MAHFVLNWLSMSPAHMPTFQDSYDMIPQEEIELFAERLIRQQLLMQYVKHNHPVLLTENRMVQESNDKIRLIIESLDIIQSSKRLVEMSTLIRVRNSIRLIIRFHELDEDTEELILF